MPSTVPVNPEIITWARKYHGLTQQQLADKVGVHLNQINKWEDEKNQPTFNQAKQLAGALRLPFVYLFLTDPPDLETPLPDLRTRALGLALLAQTFGKYCTRRLIGLNGIENT